MIYFETVKLFFLHTDFGIYFKQQQDVSSQLDITRSEKEPYLPANCSLNKRGLLPYLLSSWERANHLLPINSLLGSRIIPKFLDTTCLFHLSSQVKAKFGKLAHCFCQFVLVVWLQCMWWLDYQDLIICYYNTFENNKT